MDRHLKSELQKTSVSAESEKSIETTVREAWPMIAQCFISGAKNEAILNAFERAGIKMRMATFTRYLSKYGYTRERARLEAAGQVVTSKTQIERKEFAECGLASSVRRHQGNSQSEGDSWNQSGTNDAHEAPSNTDQKHGDGVQFSRQQIEAMLSGEFLDLSAIPRTNRKV